ncbi:hypothetical protein ACOSP7_010554 [Xanthoceras sorbifolium]
MCSDGCLLVLVREELVLFCVAEWSIWWDRNCFTHKKIVKVAVDILDRSASFLLDSKILLRFLNLSENLLQVFPSELDPSSETAETQTDAAVKSNANHVGLGGGNRGRLLQLYLNRWLGFLVLN